MAKSGLAVFEALARGEAVPAATPPERPVTGTPSVAVTSDRSGAIQALDVRGIVELAARRRLVCDLRHAVGDFVIPGTVLAELSGGADEDDARRVRGMLALGPERTIDQDPAFAIRIIVDIAIRALSPAVNDPTTATQMINHIGALLFRIGREELNGRGFHLDRNGQLRMTMPARTWRDYLEVGVSEIRLYGAASPQVCRRLRALLVDLERTVLPQNRAAVTEQRLLLERAVQDSFTDPDLRQLALVEDRQGIGGASPAPRRTDVSAVP
jgi:uncharacterized membrane protein